MRAGQFLVCWMTAETAAEQNTFGNDGCSVFTSLQLPWLCTLLPLWRFLLSLFFSLPSPCKPEDCLAVGISKRLHHKMLSFHLCWVALSYLKDLKEKKIFAWCGDWHSVSCCVLGLVLFVTCWHDCLLPLCWQLPLGWYVGRDHKSLYLVARAAFCKLELLVGTHSIAHFNTCTSYMPRCIAEWLSCFKCAVAKFCTALKRGNWIY